MASAFYNEIYKLVRLIPLGKVATYGQIATLLDKPKGARLVGWSLNICPADIPWQRVINRDGIISIENLRASKELQAELLKAEGVGVELKQGNWWVNLDKFLWSAN